MDEAAILAPLLAARPDLDKEAAMEHVTGAVAMFKFGERNRAAGTVARKHARQNWTKRAKAAGEPVAPFGKAGRPPAERGSEGERLVYLLEFVWRHHTGKEPVSTPSAPFITFAYAVARSAELAAERASLSRDVKRIQTRVARARSEGTKVVEFLDVLGWLQAPSRWEGDGPLPPWWPEYMEAMEPRFSGAD